ncbi:MAG TPA: PEP-CTERM sorting domain-containing protein [Edaphobacter sp.]|jgi:hypothetical protein|nr:PEP-CTERM sorting domain-containing protein [Edaphobacter sp.]
MRKKFLLALGLLCVFSFAGASAFCDPLPVGNYSLNVQTPTSGVHSGSDQGTLSGTLTFDAASTLVAANLTFDDITTGTTFAFTNPGPTSIDPGNFLGATIYNAIDPATFYQFSIAIPGSSSGTFNLTCGTDCHTWMDLDQGGQYPVYVELNFGNLTPAPSTPAVPEPSTLLLFATGITGGLSLLRRRLQNAAVKP